MARLALSAPDFDGPLAWEGVSSMVAVETATFGDLLRRLRKAAGLTQAELAEHAGLSIRGINDLERGARRFPHKDTVTLLANALSLAGDDRAAFLAAARRPSAPPDVGTTPDGTSDVTADYPDYAGFAAAHRSLPIGGFLGALPDGPIVAREAEMTQLGTLLDLVAGGGGRLVLLAGEPGVGKTRLAQEATRSALNRGFLVAAGRCYEPQATVAYFPFLDALHQVYTQTSPDVRARVHRKWPEVARLIPDLDRSEDSPAEGRANGRAERGAEEQQRLFWQVGSFLVALAERQPVALLLDDLQWADSASLALLQHLARHTHSDSIFLLGTYRDVVLHRLDRQRPLEAAVRDLVRERLVERIAVRRLSPAGTGALVRVVLGEMEVSQEFVDLLHSRTEGNPFFIREILLALVERGDVYRSEDRGWSQRAIEEIAVPETVRSVIGERLSRLGPEALAALHEASVFGQVFAFDEARALTGREEAGLERALEEATAAGLVREVGRERYAFHHALIQQALYAEIPTRRKRRLHRAAGEAIEQVAERERAQRAAELAWHFLQADDGSRALPYTLQAGDHAEAVYAHAEAERHYRAALALARELGDGAREAEALEKLGVALSAQSRYDAALELLEQAHTRYSAAGNMEGRGRTLAQIGWALAERGTPEQGITRLRAALTEPAELASAQPVSSGAMRAHLYFTLAQLWYVNGHYHECAEAAAEAVRLAREAGDERLELRSLAREANAISTLGDPPEAARLCELIVPRAETLGEYWTLVRAHAILHAYLGHMGMLEAARLHTDKWVAACERLGSPTELAWALDEQAGDYYFLGDWVRCREGSERALKLLQHIPATFWLPYLHYDVGQMDLYQGRVEAAHEHFRQARSMAEPSRNLQILRMLAEIESESDVLEGRPEVARQRLEPMLDRPGEETYNVTTFLHELAWAYLELGDVPRADAIVAEGITRAERAHVQAPLIDLWRIQGLIRTRKQRWHEAAAVLNLSLASSRSHPHVYGEVKALYVYGQLYAEQHEPERAFACWERALAICRRLGERLYAVHIERALTGIKVPVASPEQAGVL